MKKIKVFVSKEEMLQARVAELEKNHVGELLKKLRGLLKDGEWERIEWNIKGKHYVVSLYWLDFNQVNCIGGWTDKTIEGALNKVIAVLTDTRAVAAAEDPG